jgi:hypothetical protein
MLDVADLENYSAPVNLELHIQGQVLSVAKVGPDRLVLQDESANPRGEGVLHVTIGSTTKRGTIVIDEVRCDGREIGYRTV